MNLVQVVEAMLRDTGRTIWAQKWNLRSPLPVYPQRRAKVNVVNCGKKWKRPVTSNPPAGVRWWLTLFWHLFEVEAPHLFWSAMSDSQTCRSLEPVLFTDSIEPIRKACVIYSSLRGFHYELKRKFHFWELCRFKLEKKIQLIDSCHLSQDQEPFFVLF